MPWWLCGLMANAGIVMTEYLNRQNYGGTFLNTIPYTFAFIMIAQWGLYRSWSTAPTMMAAWAFFTAGNSAMRLVNSHFMVGEPMSSKQIGLVLVMFLVSFLIKES